MTDPLAARVHALIAQWRKQCEEYRALATANYQTQARYADRCESMADDRTMCVEALEAALAAVLAPNPEKEIEHG